MKYSFEMVPTVFWGWHVNSRGGGAVFIVFHHSAPMYLGRGLQFQSGREDSENVRRFSCLPGSSL